MEFIAATAVESRPSRSIRKRYRRARSAQAIAPAVPRPTHLIALKNSATSTCAQDERAARARDRRAGGFRRTFLYVVADDEQHLGVFRATGSARARPEAVRGDFAHAREAQGLKPDLKCCSIAPFAGYAAAPARPRFGPRPIAARGVLAECAQCDACEPMPVTSRPCSWASLALPDRTSKAGSSAQRIVLAPARHKSVANALCFSTRRPTQVLTLTGSRPASARHRDHPREPARSRRLPCLTTAAACRTAIRVSAARGHDDSSADGSCAGSAIVVAGKYAPSPCTVSRRRRNRRRRCHAPWAQRSLLLLTERMTRKFGTLYSARWNCFAAATEARTLAMGVTGPPGISSSKTVPRPILYALTQAWHCLRSALHTAFQPLSTRSARLRGAGPAKSYWRHHATASSAQV